ncbi:ATP-binding protein [Bergeyella porcorum]
MIRRLTFRGKMFLAAFFTGLLFLILIISLNFYQNQKNFEALRNRNVEKISRNIAEGLQYATNKNNWKCTDSLLVEKVYELANLHNAKVSIFGLDGALYSSSHNSLKSVSPKVLQQLKVQLLYTEEHNIDNLDATLVNSFTFLKDKQHKNTAILAVQLVESRYSMFPKIGVLLKQNFLLVLFLVCLCAAFSWWISKKLTEKIVAISQKVLSTDVNNLQSPLEYEENDEITPLVTAYNQMLVQLEEQKKMLQKTEREEAWKEMARQVAHEINNPLTPMRLTVQNFHRRYKADDPDNMEKVKTLTKTVVHQIDLISAITKSFSDFAKMPLNEETDIEIVEVIQNTLAIFPPNEVAFTKNVEQLHYKIDPLYLTRIITNIVKNGLQAIPNDREKRVEVELINQSEKFTISITDNGLGISDEQKDKVFLPNFTTKSEGMGLGLSMVKKIVEDYKGKIWFESQPNFGTTFFIEFYKF